MIDMRVFEMEEIVVEVAKPKVEKNEKVEKIDKIKKHELREEFKKIQIEEDKKAFQKEFNILFADLITKIESHSEQEIQEFFDSLD